MIAHHQQAVEMSTMASAQSVSPKVKDLASRIQKEITEMQVLLAGDL